MIGLFSWLVIAILIIVGVIAIKANHFRHKFFIIGLIVLALFIYTSIAAISDEEQTDLKSVQGWIKTAQLYVGWLANGFNTLQEITGQAIKMDWTTTDGSFFKSND